MARVSFLTGLILASAGCSVFNSGTDKTREATVPEIVAKMDKAMEPRHAITSYQLKLTVVGGDKKVRPEMISITAKAPDKIRFMTRFPDKFIVKGWDGKVGWVYSSQKGYRLLKGAELDELRFQGAYLSPSMKINQLFPGIKLLNTTVIDGKTCWKLVMTPKKELNSQDLYFYVDQKTGRIIKTEELVDTATGVIQVETVFTDYKTIDNMVMPQMMITEINGEIVETKVTELECNIPVDDLIFAPPASLMHK